MTSTTAEALALLARAAGPEELFGPRPAAGDEAARATAHRTYRHLARLVHPDRCPNRSDQAAAAFTRLANLWASYNAGTSPDPVVLATRRHAHTLGARLTTGDLANLYAATSVPAGDPHRTLTTVAKMPRSPRNNDLLANEATVLRHLAEHVEDRHAAYLPQLVDSLTHRDTATGIDRRVNVLDHLTGFYTLAEVAAAYPDGLDARDAAWMWRRLLVGLGVIHRAGVIHGAVLPEHVLIHPAQHGLVLVDFAYASTGDPVTAVVSRYRDWYPTEVLDRRAPSPATDIAMATRVITTLMGERAPAPMRAFARGCTLPAQHARPDDAWALLAELDDLLERLYGPRRFRPFTMPTSSTT